MRIQQTPVSKHLDRFASGKGKVDMAETEWKGQKLFFLLLDAKDAVWQSVHGAECNTKRLWVQSLGSNVFTCPFRGSRLQVVQSLSSLF